MFLSILFLIGFFTTMGILVYRDKAKDKIRENSFKICSKLMREVDSGDEFANMFFISMFDEGHILQVKYSFLERFGFEKKFEIGKSLEKFWETYEKEKDLFKKEPNYRLYKFFIDNVGNRGEIVENKGFITLTIEKNKPMGYNWSPYSVPIGYSFGGGGGGGSYSYYPDNYVPGLRCPAFEKVKLVWNYVENDNSVSFIIKDGEVDDFCNVCEMVCGEEIA